MSPLFPHREAGKSKIIANSRLPRSTHGVLYHYQYYISIMGIGTSDGWDYGLAMDGAIDFWPRLL